VTVAALALGRAQPSARIAGALAVASGGLVLVLLAAGTGSFDVAGAVFAVASALTYTTYILVSESVIDSVDPFALAALVLTGGTVTFAVAGGATGSLDLALSGEAWLWLERSRRFSEAGHRSTAGADPPGYSAAVCQIIPP